MTSSRVNAPGTSGGNPAASEDGNGELATGGRLACPRCGHTLPPTFREDRTYRYKLTPGLVSVLRKLAVAVEAKGKNDVHLEDDVRLSFNEQSSITKLRFFGLVAKVREHGAHKSKRWLLTRRGWRFLNCREAVPVEVMAQSNHKVAHSAETVLIASFPITERPWLQSTFETFEILEGEVFHRPQGQLQLIR